VEAGFRQADVIVESVFDTPPQEHAFLQTESGLAYIDTEGRVAVVTAGQWGSRTVNRWLMRSAWPKMPCG
jgi:CO/xanthine dehydrogenase Mo-binding subunit